MDDDKRALRALAAARVEDCEAALAAIRRVKAQLEADERAAVSRLEAARRRYDALSQESLS